MSNNDEDIFENQSEVMENILDSAENIGAKVDRSKKPILVPKRNCKFCYGRGEVNHSFPGNDGFDFVQKIRCSCVKVKYV